MTLTTTKLALYLSVVMSASHAFVIRPPQQVLMGSSTSLNLEDHIADMIDGELHRLGNKKDYEQEWMEKNRATMMQVLNAGKEQSAFMADEPDAQDFRMHAKDKILAAKDPARYCADRCVATGNCDIFEDIYELSPEEVVKFCTDCVMSEDEEPCDIPGGFYDGPMP